MSEFDYSRLRRFPDVEAPNLQAWDATDELLVAHALAAGPAGEQTVVIGDEYGAITLALTDAGMHGVRVHQDLATGRRALARNAAELGISGYRSGELDAELLGSARLVLLQLPKALAELEQIADAVARWAAPEVVLVAGGRVKHMTLAQNEVLARSFGRVQAQRSERKSRLVVASGARQVPGEPPYPVTQVHSPSTGSGPQRGSGSGSQRGSGSGTQRGSGSATQEGEFTLVAHGGAFAGAKLDIGTRALIGALSSRVAEPSPWVAEVVEAPEDGGALQQAQGPSFASETRADERGVSSRFARSTSRPRVLDLGCGTGALAVWFGLQHPAAHITATDRSAAAAASARASVEANGLADRVTVTQDDAGSELPDASFDVVLLNPPFHLGTSIHTGAATRLFEASARLLRPGGELWTVFNSSLGYRGELTRLVGRTEQISRSPKFTVTRSIRSR